MSARDLGARVLLRTDCLSARRENGDWHAELSDGAASQRAQSSTPPALG
jgi:hypothetical protein